jgi:hypothetical protein
MITKQMIQEKMEGLSEDRQVASADGLLEHSSIRIIGSLGGAGGRT